MAPFSELVMECLDCGVKRRETFWDMEGATVTVRLRLRRGHEDHAVLWDQRFGSDSNGGEPA